MCLKNSLLVSIPILSKLTDEANEIIAYHTERLRLAGFLGSFISSEDLREYFYSVKRSESMEVSWIYEVRRGLRLSRSIRTLLQGAVLESEGMARVSFELSCINTTGRLLTISPNVVGLDKEIRKSVIPSEGKKFINFQYVQPE